MAEEPEDDELEAYLRSSLSDRRKSRWGRQSLRRTSSPFLSEGLLIASKHARRLSSFTTSSEDEIALSIEEEITDEEVKENMRLNKQVIETIKLQPWRMKKKYRILRKAKAYVKKHEGELAQSKRSKDVFAKYTLLWSRGWNRFKREVANFMVMLTPWEMRIKRIESHFGSVVASYFTFLRWVFWINCIISAFVCCFLMVPEVLRGAKDPTGMRKEIKSDEAESALNLKNIWDFEGYLKYSPIFYGYYSNTEKTVEGYRVPLAYFLTSLSVYIFSFFAILRRMAENSRMSKLSEKDDECIFAWKLFTGWDYMIGNPETAYNKVASLVMGFKEAILEEKEKKKEAISWKLIAVRIAANFFVLLLLASSAYAVVLVVTRSQEPEAQEDGSWYRQNEVTLVVSFISNLFPNLFDLIGMLELYHPRVQLRWQLARIQVLNLLNLYTLIFSLFVKVYKTNNELRELARNITTQLDYEDSIELMNITEGQARRHLLSSDMLGTDFDQLYHINCTTYFIQNCTLAMQNVTGKLNLTDFISSTFSPTSLNVSSIDGDYFLENNTLEENGFDSFMWNIANLTSRGNWTSAFKTNLNATYPPIYSGNYSLFEDHLDESLTSEDFLQYEDKPSTTFDNWTFSWKLLKGNDSFSTLDSFLSSVLSTSSTLVLNESLHNQSTGHPVAEIFYPPEQNCTVAIRVCEDIGTPSVTDGTDGDLESVANATASEFGATINGTDTSSPCQYSEDLPCVKQCLFDEKMKKMKKRVPPPSMKDLERVDEKIKEILRKKCWETTFGQELVKLTVMDLVMTVIATILTDFIRAIIVRYANHCWCWDLEKGFPGYGDFKIAENILHLVNNQGLVWMGMFFSPGLPAINTAKLCILVYVRSWAVLTANIPHETVFRASRSNNFYYALLLIMLFLCTLPVGFACVWLEPSWHCGPFSQHKRIYHVFTSYVLGSLPPFIVEVVNYMTSPGVVIPLILLLVLIIYYLTSLTGSLREANNDLKLQLRREKSEIEKPSTHKTENAENGTQLNGNDSTKWTSAKKILPVLPNKFISKNHLPEENKHSEESPKKHSGKRVQYEGRDSVDEMIYGWDKDLKNLGVKIPEEKSRSPMKPTQTSTDSFSENENRRWIRRGGVTVTNEDLPKITISQASERQDSLERNPYLDPSGDSVWYPPAAVHSKSHRSDPSDMDKLLVMATDEMKEDEFPAEKFGDPSTDDDDFPPFEGETNHWQLARNSLHRSQAIKGGDSTDSNGTEKDKSSSDYEEK